MYFKTQLLNDQQELMFDYKVIKVEQSFYDKTAVKILLAQLI